MKALIYSDLHLHLWKQFGVDEKTGLPNRFLDQILILRQIGKIIKARNIKLALSGGDITHKVGEIATEVLNLAHSEFEKWNVDQIFVPGNHDMVNRKDPKWYQISSQTFSKAMNIPEGLPFKLKTVGYNDSVEGIEGYDVVVLHKTPIGCKVGNYTFSDGVDWKKLASKNKFVFFGHIHQRQQLADNCFVIGSPMHLNFGDIGDRGVYIIDTESWELEFVKLKYKEFLTVSKEDSVDITNKDNYYRLYLDADDKRENIDNVMTVSVPSYYDERIKSENTLDILKEWCEINKKDSSYFNHLEDLIKECNLFSSEVFKGRIDSVDIKDFFSVGEVKYKIEKGFTFIEGETDTLTSNGAGKSSMFGDAIYWGLFGETTKGIKGNDVIRFGCKDCKVEIVLKSDKTIRIVRSRKKGTSVFIDDKEIWEGERDSDKQSKIEESILGFSKDFFKTASYFSQEDLKMLTLMGDADRNNMIINLLGFELYDTLYDKASSVCKQLDLEIESKLNDKNTFEQKVQFINEKINNANDKELFLTDELSKIEGRFAEREKELNDYIDHIKEEIKSLSKHTEEIEEIDFGEREEKLSKIKEVINNNILNIRSFLSKQEYTIDDCRSRSKKIESLGNKCPTCLNDIPDQHKGQILEGYETDIKAAQDSYDKKRSTLELENEKLKKVKDKEQELSNERSKYEREVLILKRNKEDLKKLYSNVEDNQKSVKSLLSSKEKELKSINIQIDSVNDDIKDQEERLKDNQKEINSILTAVNKSEKEAEVMTFWKDSFGSKGIKSLLLDRFCNEFNKLIVEYISIVSGGEISTVMSPRRILKSGEERNKLDVLVYIDNRERMYQSLSGGEKRRVDVAICLALNEWCGKKFGIPFGFLGLVILDEVFSYIDKKGEESIANLLTEEGMRKSILVISHTSDLANYSDRIWKVKKDNGISILEI